MQWLYFYLTNLDYWVSEGLDYPRNIPNFFCCLGQSFSAVLLRCYAKPCRLISSPLSVVCLWGSLWNPFLKKLVFVCPPKLLHLSVLVTEAYALFFFFFFPQRVFPFRNPCPSFSKNLPTGNILSAVMPWGLPGSRLPPKRQQSSSCTSPCISWQVGTCQTWSWCSAASELWFDPGSFG